MRGRWPGCVADHCWIVLEAVLQGETAAAEIEVLDVEDLEAGVQEQPVRVVGGIRGETEEGDEEVPERVRKEGGLFGVEEDVELDLAHALRRELLIEGNVRVVPDEGELRRAGVARSAAARHQGIRDLEQLVEALLRLDVVAVVGAEHLYLIEPDAALGKVAQQKGIRSSGRLDLPAVFLAAARPVSGLDGDGQREKHESRADEEGTESHRGSFRCRVTSAALYRDRTGTREKIQATDFCINHAMI